VTTSSSGHGGEADTAPSNVTHPADLYLEQLGPGSRRTMTEALGKLARMASGRRCDARSFRWQDLRIEHTSILRGELAATLAPATVNKHLAALRGVLKQAWQLGLMSTEDYQRAIDLPSVQGPAPRKIRVVSPGELRALVATCERDTSPAGTRDSALLALLIGVGLRRAEVVALDLAHYDPETGVLSVRGTPSRSPRRLTARVEERQTVSRWLDRRGSAPGPLFNPINKGGRIEVRRLSEQAIYVACHKRAAEAGLPPVSPEDLRRAQAASRPRTLRKALPQTPVATAQTA
jgi:integrase